MDPPAPNPAAPAKSFRLEPFSYAEARALARELDLAEPVAVTLVRRGYRTPEQARAFLEADELHDPFAFEGMAEVVERIRAATAARRRITVHGDYDVDGVCSTAILVRALRELGAECDWYIPGRLEDGYGLSAAGVERLAARGTGLLVTTDCGITCAEEVSAARRAGMEVIVTDHHQQAECLPDCPILHPVVCRYPCEELCATGVAYKLVAALLGAEAADSDLDLVALATIADLVPLRGENRALVRRGLAEARRARRPGLRALIAAAAIEPERLDEGDIAFRLAPRINAAGRLYRADAGVELLLSADPDRAAAIAAELDGANRERRAAELEVLAAAERARGELPDELADAPGLVIAGEGWHPGVVGIVASRLAERLWRPVVLIGLDGQGRGRGSGRGVPGFDLLDALRACERCLSRYGGHRAAAGLEIEAARVGELREAFAAHCASVLGDGEPTRTEVVDAVIGGENLGLEVAEQFARLAPFGKGNPDVRLLVPSARLSDVRPMGNEERHARFSLTSGGGRALGVAFGVNGSLETAQERPFDVSIALEVNHWNGAVEPRVVLGELYGGEELGDDGGPGIAAEERAGIGEWMRRLEDELRSPLAEWPPPELCELARGRARRAVVDRRGGSGAATVAALASTGEPVLVLCADALRRRRLVESVASPARYGGGALAIADARLADRVVEERLEAVVEGGGVALADWPRLGRRPDLPERFEHVVAIDPPPFAHLEDLADRSGPRGFLHIAWGDPEVDLALRVHDHEWPLRERLTTAFKALRDAPGELGAERLREAVEGGGALPRSPEVCARSLRVLLELGLVAWEGWHPGVAGLPDRPLGVVSSETTDLQRSEAFVAYGRRYEEGKRYLSRRRRAE